MRTAFIETLTQLTQKNKKICLLTGDLGYTVFENFRTHFPKNFINAGVAEGNMATMAAGLATSGRIPIIYSIAPFASMRAFEQIRNDICLMKSNVKIVGVGAGLAYSHAGPTHHSIEDISIMRTLPHMMVICPSDPYEVKQLLPKIIKHDGPVYFRLGKRGEPVLHDKKIEIEIGKGIEIERGTDLCLIACGSILGTAKQAAVILRKKQVSVGIVSMPTIKPLDVSLLRRLIKKYQAWVSIEEHSIIGGFGGALSEFIAEQKDRPRFKRIGIADAFSEKIGDHEYMKNLFGLSGQKIAQVVSSWYFS